MQCNNVSVKKKERGRGDQIIKQRAIKESNWEMPALVWMSERIDISLPYCCLFILEYAAYLTGSMVADSHAGCCSLAAATSATGEPLSHCWVTLLFDDLHHVLACKITGYDLPRRHLSAWMFVIPVLELSEICPEHGVENRVCGTCERTEGWCRYVIPPCFYEGRSYSSRLFELAVSSSGG